MSKQMALALLWLCGALHTHTAAGQTRHEVGMSAGGGISALNYKLYDADARLLWGIGGEAALNYTIFLNAKWGVGTGAGFGLYNSTAILTGTMVRSQVQNDFPLYENTSYVLQTTLTKYEEQQRLLSLYVPLFVQYIVPGRHTFYVRVGGKLLLPMLMPATYDVKNAAIANVAIIEGRPDQPMQGYKEYGWDEYAQVKHNGEVTFKMGVMLSAEVGTRWKLSSKNSLYTGLYFDYGAFMDMHSPDQKSMVIDRTDEEPHYKINSILQAENGTGLEVSQGDPLTKMVAPIAVGIVLRMAWGFKSIPPAKERPDIIRIDTIVKQDTIMVPFHDTIVQTKTEVLYRDLEKAIGEENLDRGVLVRRDTVIINRDHYHYRTDTINNTNTVVKYDTVRTYKNTFIISNYLASAYFVSGEKKATLDHVISMLLTHPAASVIVEGHTCSYGSDALNKALGMRRAQTVAYYLVQNGIPQSRIKVVSKADTEPILLNDGEYNRRKNRRVKLIIVDKEGKNY